MPDVGLDAESDRAAGRGRQVLQQLLELPQGLGGINPRSPVAKPVDLLVEPLLQRVRRGRSVARGDDGEPGRSPDADPFGNHCRQRGQGIVTHRRVVQGAAGQRDEGVAPGVRTN